jgi:hypothetical protein
MRARQAAMQISRWICSPHYLRIESFQNLLHDAYLAVAQNVGRVTRAPRVTCAKVDLDFLT